MPFVAVRAELLNKSALLDGNAREHTGSAAIRVLSALSARTSDRLGR